MVLNGLQLYGFVKIVAFSIFLISISYAQSQITLPIIDKCIYSYINLDCIERISIDNKLQWRTHYSLIRLQDKMHPLTIVQEKDVQTVNSQLAKLNTSLLDLIKTDRDNIVKYEKQFAVLDLDNYKWMEWLDNHYYIKLHVNDIQSTVINILNKYRSYPCTCRNLSILHMKMVFLHPFINGNGKFSRTFLWNSGCFVTNFPRSQYLSSVLESIETGNYDIFYTFFQKHCYEE
jgi:hypothetical protein